MHKNLYLLSLSFLCSICLHAQAPIDVAESTLKVQGMNEEVFYYGFAAGDQIIFSFKEADRKTLKEIEIIELPSSTKFMDYKVKEIESKIIQVHQTGIYKFRFANSALMGRICKFKIQRIPSSDSTINFNTNVYWRTVYDTTYTNEDERFLVKADTSISNITDEVAKVHSAGNLNGNKTTFNFSLPEHTVSWSYYIGVNQAGQEAFAKATKTLAGAGGKLISRFPGYGPLAAVALGAMSYLTVLQAGEDIDFYIVDGDNVNLFSTSQSFRYLKKGKVINDFSQMNAPLRGMYHVCLYNDNAITPVSVAVKITAIVVHQQWDVRQVKKMHLKMREEAYLKG
jgi:hypothetical protein